MKRLHLILLAITFLIGCSKENPLNTEDLRGTISGTITDQYGKPISGVNVGTDGSHDGVSDAGGYYAITDVEPGNYSVIYSKASYFDTTIDTIISVAKLGDVTNLDVVLHKISGSVSGTVTDSAGNKLDNVNVTFSPEDKTMGEKTINTGVDGAFKVDGIDLGIYTVEYIRTSYLPMEIVKCTLSLSQYEDTLSLVMKYAGDGGVVEGVVCTSEKSAAVGAVVKVSNSSSQGEATVGSTGLYTIPGLQTGKYGVEVVSIGHKDTVLVDSISVVFDSVTILDTIIIEADNIVGNSVITGRVLQSSDSTAVKGGVSVTALNGISTVVGADGLFTLPALSDGIYQLTIEGGIVYADTVITDINLGIDDTLDIGTIYLNEDIKVPRTLYGSILINNADIDSVLAYITGDQIATKKEYGLRWLPSSKTYTGTIHVPETGYEWDAHIFIFDSENKLTGYQTMDFDKLSGDVAMPEFDGWNAKPNAIPSANVLTIPVNDSIKLTARAYDLIDFPKPYENPSFPDIAKWEWSINGGPFVEVSGNGDTTLVAPPAPNSNFLCVLRVTDQDGNIGSKEISINVIASAPIITATAITDTVSIFDTIKLSGTGTDNGSIVKWEWKCGDSPYVEVASPEYQFKASGTPNSRLNCILRATDDDGMISTATVPVAVLLDAPVFKQYSIDADKFNQEGLAYSEGEMVTVSYGVSDGFGNVEKIEVGYLQFGQTDTVYMTPAALTSSSLQFPAPNIMSRGLGIFLRATDDDGVVATSDISYDAIISCKGGAKLTLNPNGIAYDYPAITWKELVTSDGGLIYYGYKKDGQWVMKKDKDGSVLWEHVFPYEQVGSTLHSYDFYSADENSVGDILLVGRKNENDGKNNTDIRMIKTTTNGTVLLDTIFGKAGEHDDFSGVFLDNGGILLYGTSSNSVYSAKLIKCSEDGSTIWEKTGYSSDNIRLLSQLSDGSFLFGIHNSFDDIYTIQILDSLGEKIDTSYICEYVYDSPGHSHYTKLDNGFAMIRSINSGLKNEILLFNTTGVLQNSYVVEENVSGMNKSMISSLVYHTDGNLYASGSVYIDYVRPDHASWVFKFNPQTGTVVHEAYYDHTDPKSFNKRNLISPQKDGTFLIRSQAVGYKNSQFLGVTRELRLDKDFEVVQ